MSNLDVLYYGICSLKYLRSATLGCKDIGIRKSEFVGKKLIPLIKFFFNSVSTISTVHKPTYPA